MIDLIIYAITSALAGWWLYEWAKSTMYCSHPNKATYYSTGSKVCVDCKKLFLITDHNIKSQR